MGNRDRARGRTGILDDEIQFIREGRGVWTVSGKTFEGGPGDIFVIQAGEIHSFKAVGDSPLIQLDIHLSPTFIQENLQNNFYCASCDITT